MRLYPFSYWPFGAAISSNLIRCVPSPVVVREQCRRTDLRCVVPHSCPSAISKNNLVGVELTGRHRDPIDQLHFTTPDRFPRVTLRVLPGEGPTLRLAESKQPDVSLTTAGRLRTSIAVIVLMLRAWSEKAFLPGPAIVPR